MQPYLPAINGFYCDHGAEPEAQGDLISKLVAHMLEEHPPPGFLWTSHSLRKGAATAAYAIGVLLLKIKHFNEWAHLSSVVLDYINPTALPCAASWQLFG
eukprot:jgi/Tetstr1/421679/TSEL_012618.t1